MLEVFQRALDARACLHMRREGPPYRLFEKAFRNVYLGPGGRFEAAVHCCDDPYGNHLYSEETAGEMLVESLAGRSQPGFLRPE